MICKFDRLSRSLKDVLQLMEWIAAPDASFRSLTESVDTTPPAGQMMMEMGG